MNGNAEKKRILFVNSSSKLYGADRSLLDIVTHLDNTVFEPVVLVPEIGPLATEMNRFGVSTISTNFVHAERRFFRPIRFIRFIKELIISIRKIKTIIQDESIDLVHSNTSACIASAIASRLAGKPHVWHIRELCTNPKIIRLLYRVMIPLLADKAIAASQVVRINYSTNWNRLLHKFILLSHGVDSKRFENGTDTIRKEFSIPPGVKIVGNVGMLRTQKGQHLFLSVAQMVKQKYPDIRFVIAGDMYYENGMIDPTLKNLCNSLGLDNNVIFTGFRTDIENVFAALNVFVHTSVFQESYGRTILESMASGKPIVAFNTGGPSELVRHGQTGFLTPPGNLQLMAERITELLLDDKLSNRMGNEGRRIIRNHYSNENYIKCLQELYSQLA